MASGRERFLDALRGAGGALCDDCVTRRAVFSQRQAAYQLAERLRVEGVVGRGKGVRCVDCQNAKKCSWLPAGGAEVVHGVDDVDSPQPPEALGSTLARAAAFEVVAREAMSRKFGLPLVAGTIDSVPKVWDFVSPDHSVVGDAKFYTLVNGTSTPPAKFSVIAEHVWLLQHTPARHPFLVFGNDRRVPELWLARYAGLADGVAFFFIENGGDVETLRE